MSGFEYAPNWSQIRTKAMRQCKRCCFCLSRDTRAVHHLKNRRSLIRRVLGRIFLKHPMGLSNASYEIPGWDCVPVCDRCHDNAYGRSLSKRSVHYTGANPHWIQSHEYLANHNTAAIAWRLRLTFLLLSNKFLMLFILGVFAAIAFWIIGGLILLIRAF